MSNARLGETSYIVMGLLEQVEPATPYDLKRFAGQSTVNFWSVPHTQLYTECARLAEAGLLSERQETTGRRRRIYRLTSDGRAALDSWRAEPTGDLYEVRDRGILKLFLGSDPKTLAPLQAAAHERKLAELEQMHGANPGMPEGMRLALEGGMALEREFIRFWAGLSDPAA